MELIRFFLPELPVWIKWVNYVVFMLLFAYVMDAIGARLRRS